MQTTQSIADACCVERVTDIEITHATASPNQRGFQLKTYWATFPASSTATEAPVNELSVAASIN